MKHFSILFSLSIILAFSLAACAPATPPATPTPTLTPQPTSTPTPTVTPSPMPTATPELQDRPIDLEKLYVMPPSYEYVVAHPEEFVQGPDPLEDIEIFKDWWLYRMIPALGYQNDKEINVYSTTFAAWVGTRYYWGVVWSEDAKPLMGTPQFFYFDHIGTVFPVLILTVQDNVPSLGLSHNVGTYAYILHEKDPSQPDSVGLDGIRYLYEGRPIRLTMSIIKAEPFQILDDVTMMLLNDGYNWADFDGANWIGRDPTLTWDEWDDKFAIGVGEVGFFK